MIKRFEKNRGQFYMNELELIVAFALNELIEYIAMFNAYDKSSDTIDYRRVVYILTITAMILFAFVLFTVTCSCVLFSLV